MPAAQASKPNHLRQTLKAPFNLNNNPLLDKAQKNPRINLNHQRARHHQSLYLSCTNSNNAWNKLKTNSTDSTTSTKTHQ